MIKIAKNFQKKKKKNRNGLSISEHRTAKFQRLEFVFLIGLSAAASFLQKSTVSQAASRLIKNKFFFVSPAVVSEF